MAPLQLLHGWWIAIAQNVAPGRFRARERRRIEEDHRRLLTSSDIPTFALAGTQRVAIPQRGRMSWL